MLPFDVLLLTLATFYAAYVLTSTSGPFDVFLKLRTRLPLGGLTKCLPCACIWFSFLFIIIHKISQDFIIVIAIAGACVLVWRYTGAGNV